METVIVEGAEVIETLVGTREGQPVEYRRYGRCCDTGNYDREYANYTREDVLWAFHNWHREPERFEVEFVENKWGAADFSYPVIFRIHSGDACEPNTHEYTVYPYGTDTN